MIRLLPFFLFCYYFLVSLLLFPIWHTPATRKTKKQKKKNRWPMQFISSTMMMDEENMATVAAGVDDLSDLTSSRVQPLKRAVPVPSADLRAALSAIQTNAASLHIRLNDDSLTEQERMELEAKIAANGSLRDHIARLCRPSSDTVHEETLQKVREELRGGGGKFSGRRGSCADDDDDASDDSSVWDDVDEEEGFTTDEEEEEEEEVDESDLIDQNTLRKVRELRETVRTISNRVNDKMADVTERAVQLAGREVEGMRDLGGKVIAGDGGDNEENEGTAAADPFSDDAELSSTDAAKIATMQSTLTSLSESVAKIETASTDEEGNGGSGASSLPTAVSDLQSTVDTVAAALAKARLRREEGDEAILSQTERAIMSKPEKEGASGGGIGDADGDIRAAEARARIAGMDPQERFAVFMSSSANGGGTGGSGAV